MIGRWLWQYITGPAPKFAPAIAFTAFVAIFPITIGLVSVLLLIFPREGLPHAVNRVILQTFPLDTRREIGNLLNAIPRHEKTIVLAAFLAMFWSGSALFSTLGGALNAIQGTPGRNVLRQRLIGLRTIVVLLAAIVLMILLESVGDNLPHALWVGALLAGAPLMMLVGFIYSVAPNNDRRRRDVIPGAVLATVGIEVVTLAFPLYGRVVASTSIYGRGLALALVLLFWLYLVSHVVLLGASFNQIRHDDRSHA
ncbi:MAG: YihY/virulence factor BrkB family protein [Candidatus Dormibacteria bacterium]